MAATTTVTGSEDKAPVVEPPRRGNLFHKIARPYRQSHGVQRFMLITGTVVSVVLIAFAIFAPALALYNYVPYKAAAGRFPQQGEPTGRNHWGTTVQVFDVMSR